MIKMEEYTNYLAHHGIKGQRWGIRRYQNPDGSLTDAGRKKLGKLEKKSSKFLSKHAKYEKKILKSKRRTWDPHNADNLLRFERKSNKFLKKHAKYEKKIYKLKKHMNKDLKRINKQVKTNGKDAVEKAKKNVDTKKAKMQKDLQNLNMYEMFFYNQTAKNHGGGAAIDHYTKLQDQYLKSRKDYKESKKSYRKVKRQ